MFLEKKNEGKSYEKILRILSSSAWRLIFLGKWKGFRLFCYLLCPLVYRARFLNPDRIVDEHSLNDVLDVTRDKNWKNKSAGSQEKMRRKKKMSTKAWISF